MPKLNTVTLYQIRKSGRWQWRHTSKNGENLHRGSQWGGFKSPQGAWKNLLASVAGLVRDGVGGTLLPMNPPTKRDPEIIVEVWAAGDGDGQAIGLTPVLRVVRIDRAA